MKRNKPKLKVFDVPVTESCKRVFRVLAEDEVDAEQILEDLFNSGDDRFTCDEGNFVYRRDAFDIALSKNQRRKTAYSRKTVDELREGSSE